MHLLTYNPFEKLSFEFTKYTIEKVKTGEITFKHDILRKQKATIEITANHEKQTFTVGGKTYPVLIDKQYTYKVKGKSLIVSNFGGFIQFIREAGNRENVWHHTAKALLLKLSKGNYTEKN
jgi:hypothetical protein